MRVKIWGSLGCPDGIGGGVSMVGQSKVEMEVLAVNEKAMADGDFLKIFE